PGRSPSRWPADPPGAGTGPLPVRAPQSAAAGQWPSGTAELDTRWPTGPVQAVRPGSGPSPQPPRPQSPAPPPPSAPPQSAQPRPSQALATDFPTHESLATDFPVRDARATDPRGGVAVAEPFGVETLKPPVRPAERRRPGRRAEPVKPARPAKPAKQ